MWPGGPYGARIMSYGCTRLADANAIWLYDHAPLGTPVWNVN